MDKIKTIGLYLGNRCNVACKHCLTNSSPGGQFIFSDEEIKKFINGVCQNDVEEIAFTGGEPTLDLELLGHIIGEFEQNLNKDIKFSVVTNGYFASSDKHADEILKKIPKISKVTISFDKFHSEFILEENIQNLITSAKKRNIFVSGQVCVETPFDLKFAEVFKKNSVEYKFLQISTLGRAQNLENQIIRSDINKSEINNLCPQKDFVMYIPLKGFSFCCGDLVYSKLFCEDNRIFYSSIKELKESKLNRIIQTTKIVNMLDELNEFNKFDKEYYSPCEICNDYINKKVLKNENYKKY